MRKSEVFTDSLSEELAVRVQNVSKELGGRAVLNNLTMDIPKSKFTLIRGESGSGKTTLLECMTGIGDFNDGQIVYSDAVLNSNGSIIEPQAISRFRKPSREDTMARWRGRNLGFVFQKSNLIPSLTAIDNIRLPHRVVGNEIDKEWEHELFSTLGIENLLPRMPRSFSVGEQQRIAIARALVHQPKIVYADEPTASVDPTRKGEVFGMFESLSSNNGTTFVVTSHDEAAVAHSDNVVYLKNGGIMQPEVQADLSFNDVHSNQ